MKTVIKITLLSLMFCLSLKADLIVLTGANNLISPDQIVNASDETLSTFLVTGGASGWQVFEFDIDSADYRTMSGSWTGDAISVNGNMLYQTQDGDENVFQDNILAGVNVIDMIVDFQGQSESMNDLSFSSVPDGVNCGLAIGVLAVVTILIFRNQRTWTSTV